MWLLATLTKIIDALAPLFIMSFLYGWLLRQMPATLLREGLLGLLFGLGGALSLLDPLAFANGMMVALAAAFVGFRAGMVALALGLLLRFSLPWPEESANIANQIPLLVANFIGGAVWGWKGPRQRVMAPDWLTSLGFLATVEALAFVVRIYQPSGAGAVVLPQAVHMIGLWIGAMLMLREARLAMSDRRNLELALYDPLTATLNRRGLARAIKAEGLGADYAILCCDIDNFKGFNDRAGHGDGDRLLILLGHILREVMPRNTIIARLGGDEFAVVLRGAAAAEAVALGRQVVERMRRAELGEGAHSPQTISLGHASARGRHGFASVFNAADSALYRAKAAGGNRLCSAPSAGG